MSLSGPGSDIGGYTIPGIDFLAHVIRTYNIRNVLDVPCGDANWQFQSWEMDSLCTYVGMDVAPAVIRRNWRKFAHHSNKLFALWDLTRCSIPRLVKVKESGKKTTRPFDLLHVRDVLQHLSMDQGRRAAANLLASGAKYVVSTTFPHPKRNNTDIKTGLAYENNLSQPPFNFPKPLNCTRSHERTI